MRNNESHFGAVPKAEIQRSRFDRSNRLLTTFDTGELIPIYCEEVLPGDTVTMDVSSLVRMTTPIFPVMDSAFLDTYFFFVPNRLVWDHWKEFNGENNSGYWTQPTEYNVPQITAPSNGGWNSLSLADYFGLPTNVENISVSHLPFRCYTLIWNEWFRDQNYMSPADFYKTDADTEGFQRIAESQYGIPYTSAIRGGGVLPVSKYHDYFTSVLPAPQKGEAVDIPMFSGDLPVTASSQYHSLPGAALHWTANEGTFSGANHMVMSNDGHMYPAQVSSTGASLANGVYPDNLWVRLSNVDIGTINQLRQAFQIQKLFEKDARGGTRYTEILQQHFGVQSPDSRVQRPEYLGGKRVPINVDQVLQTSASSNKSPQGNTAAFSLTTDVDSAFTKSFVEHGYLIGLCAVRTDHTYQQGIQRHWSRKRRFDYYWPTLAHIGEQAVLKKEILATGTEYDEEAFGYQEAWADYRYKPSYVTGAFRSNYDATLDSWHYADFFEPDPLAGTASFVADSEFIREHPYNVWRTLAVTGEPQFLANFYFKSIWTRPMPLYSVPGLIDHF